MQTRKKTKGKFLSYFFFFSFLPAILQVSCQKNAIQTAWDAAQIIESRITSPVFPDREYRVTDFGAIGDSTTPCFESFKKAVDRCNQEGGGKVIVPPGVYYLNGPIHLKSNVHLYLSEGARLEFSQKPEDYLPLVLTRWEGTELFNYSPFVYAYQATNVAITGKGVIDGNAEKSFALWKPKQKKDQLTLRQMGNDGVALYKRVFGEGHFLRPGMIQFYSCKNVLIDGITILDAPFWCIHPVFCTNVTVRNVVVDSWNPNNDGVDPDGCVDVLIENCNFHCGDDAVAIKSGRDQDGWRIGQSTENVIIRNCTMNSKANGLCIGSEMSGGVRNIYMENCKIGEAKSTIYFKSNPDRGGMVENVFVRNITVKRAKTAFIRFDSNYKGHRGNYFPPIFRKFYIENVQCDTADNYGLYASGLKDAPILDVFLKDITIRHVEKPLFTRFISNFRLLNVYMNGEKVTEVSDDRHLPNVGEEITW